MRHERSEPSATADPRRRRSTKEVERLILDAARSAFAARGYAGATVREIAEQAGVYEPMIYRRYGSKSELYQAAVLAPLGGALDAFLAVDTRGKALPFRFRSLVEPLYALFAQNRQVAVALVAREQISGASNGDEEPGRRELTRILDMLVPLTEEVVRVESPSEDPAAVIAVTLGMTLGVALLEPYLIHAGYGLTPETLLDEMTNFRFPPHGAFPTGPAGADLDAGSLSADARDELSERLEKAKEQIAKIEAELRALAEGV